ncbi:hypothetical protein M5K25_006446 [Dendrobium thyrsiflorum]|uniref:Disease resistance N-terminal domain-containing protein n=1 Tax=Dendrobium thyrsiflorum TaxID=117978 RepID=A0ABD0VBT9_DENTH
MRLGGFGTEKRNWEARRAIEEGHSRRICGIHSTGYETASPSPFIMAAESILIAVFSQIMRKLLSSTTQQLGVAFGTEANLNKLGRILGSIQIVLVDAEDQQTANTGIKIWLSALKVAAYKIDDVLDDFIFEARRKSLNQENMLKKVLQLLFIQSSMGPMQGPNPELHSSYRQ